MLQDFKTIKAHDWVEVSVDGRIEHCEVLAVRDHKQHGVALQLDFPLSEFFEEYHYFELNRRLPGKTKSSRCVITGIVKAYKVFIFCLLYYTRYIFKSVNYYFGWLYDPTTLSLRAIIRKDLLSNETMIKINKLLLLHKGL